MFSRSTIVCLFLAMAIATAPRIAFAQIDGDVFGRSLILNDGGIATSTKNTITIIPAVEATLTTDYSLILPNALPTASDFLSVTSITGTLITLGWTSLPTTTSPYEEATAGVQNIRRIASLVNGPLITPGALATDLSAGHTAASQTATANYGTITGGRNNTNSGVAAGILSGDGNSTASGISAILGGISNTIGASGSRSFIGGGGSNSVNATFSSIVAGSSNSINGANFSFIGAGNSNAIGADYGVIFGGQNNNINGGPNSFIGGGSGNLSSVDSAVIVGGLNNIISGGQAGCILGGNGNSISGSGTRALVLGGESNTASGSASVVLGGRNMTVSGTYSAGFNSGSAMTIAAGSSVAFGSSNLWLSNNSSTSSETRFFEPQATTGAFPAVGTNYVSGMAAGSMANDNTYTLPIAIGTAGQVLRIATAPAPTSTTAALDFVTLNIATVVTQVIVADNTIVTVANTTSFLRLDGNGNPATRTVTLANSTSDGQVLVIRGVAFGANGIELQDAGNLRLSGDVQLNNNDTICLEWDNTNSFWIEVSRRNN